MSSNKFQKTLNKLYDTDRKDRMSFSLKKLSEKKRWKIISKNDESRVALLKELLKTKPKLAADDYFKLGIIFQHAPSIETKEDVVKFAKKGMVLGSEKCKWLFAAGTDRLLMMRRKKQKFGTQYVKNKKNEWELYPVNPSTTDGERAKYNILPMAKILARIDQIKRDPKLLNNKKVGLTRKR